MELDVLIRGGTVVDGSGQPGVHADVGVRGDRIVAVGDFPAARAAQTVGAAGKVVAPGFIDIHTHSDLSLLLDPHGESKVRQGVTTEVIGNCSYTAYPVQPAEQPALKASMLGNAAGDLEWDWTDLEGYRRRFNSPGAALNVAPLVGHCPIRVAAAMGYDDRAPTPDELAAMQRLVAEAMDQGAFGLSVGLTLAPSCYADTDELVDLAKVVAQYGGFYAAHQRHYPGRDLAAREETLAVGRRAGVAVQIAHNNISGKPFWHLLPEMLQLLERERARGVDVTYDVYPYQAGMTGLDQLMPGWAQDGGPDALVARLQDLATHRRIYDELAPGRSNGLLPWDWEAIHVAETEPPGDPDWIGLTVGQVAEMMGVDGLEAFLKLTEYRTSATFHLQNEDNTRLLMQHPLGMIGSDGNAVTIDTPSVRGKPHPRYFGTFPRVLGRFVRGEQLLPLPEAIRKMTSAPAERLGLQDRGLLAAGRVADITIFDPETITDNATFDSPLRYSTGVDSVLVAGELVLRQGRMTQALPGRALAKA